MKSTFDDLRSWAKENGIGQLKNLTDQELAALEWLDLSRKGLTTLPDSMGSLSSLKYLNISNNQISILPKGLGLLPHLADLYKHNNPLTVESEERFYEELEDGDLGKIRKELAGHMSYWGILLPRSSVTDRKRGILGDLEEGFVVVPYLFGKDDKGEYLEYFFEERRYGQLHQRIYESGKAINLDTVPPVRKASKDPEEDQRLKEAYHEEVTRIYKLLRDKGFINY